MTEEAKVTKPTKERKISHESAENQLESFLEYYDIEFDDIENERSHDAAMQTKKKIIRAIVSGRIEINEVDGVPLISQHLKNTDEEKTLNYVEITGRHKLVLDQKKEDKNYSKIYTLLASLSNTSESVIAKLKAADMGIAESLGFLFLQV